MKIQIDMKKEQIIKQLIFQLKYLFFILIKRLSSKKSKSNYTSKKKKKSKRNQMKLEKKLKICSKDFQQKQNIHNYLFCQENLQNGHQRARIINRRQKLTNRFTKEINCRYEENQKERVLWLNSNHFIIIRDIQSNILKNQNLYYLSKLIQQIIKISKKLKIFQKIYFKLNSCFFVVAFNTKNYSKSFQILIFLKKIIFGANK
ncbi:hypothetical protein TTHERM_000670219 (macronuclear) [Tetrahymena thermophila SB210]|uniref:Uncharacterized protein n=1 Tax=Tetrahymena thermophila (strain SB210) TaxID=312017 RepID=W7WX24_TETTS|nr:hypothetical protein TTHERM_000670219 [Tetrahymena thermophila SB210]EWS71345.1 hypothetical protein TTHERM_000670219 [Tetrahymena thermophila SB210]|eukprot:XP_012656119.1 hypothetical protein TTHERM_000670219 [Tetrahymena thermophila SB210]